MYTDKTRGDWMRKFNVTGTCVPEEHYMVDISEKLAQIKTMVDAKEYFTINRGRQYGKTTTLVSLERYLRDKYIVISLSFEGLGESVFSSEEKFCREFLKLIKEALELSGYSSEEQAKWENESVDDFMSLSRHVREICRYSNIQYVLMIDEVDKTSNNVVFLDFLSKLREQYLARRIKKGFTFHSVILAGVYDIRTLKLKLTQEGFHTPVGGETTTQNSPWNIAADFDVDMSFSSLEIETMLTSYEQDYQIGMDIPAIASEIYNYTNGYPVLVSIICKYIDEKLEKKWDVQGVRRAINIIINRDIPLFQNLVKNLKGNQDLSNMIYDVLILGKRWRFTFADPVVVLGYRYGYLIDSDHGVRVSNKIFEMIMSDYFVNKAQRDEFKLIPSKAELITRIVVNGNINMQVCLEKFTKYYHQHYSEKDVKFIEREARFFFLFFLNSVVNGRGFVHTESGFTDESRMDVVVNYLDQQFIVELKIWRGQKRHENAYKQLLGYMDKMSLDEGYLLTFDFRKKRVHQQEWVEVEGGRKVFDVII